MGAMRVSVGFMARDYLPLDAVLPSRWLFPEVRRGTILEGSPQEVPERRAQGIFRVALKRYSGMVLRECR